MFGTYQREEEQAVYGIGKSILHKSNPIYINFHEYAEMIQDVRSTTSWKKKLFYIFGDPLIIVEQKKILKVERKIESFAKVQCEKLLTKIWLPERL